MADIPKTLDELRTLIKEKPDADILDAFKDKEIEGLDFIFSEMPSHLDAAKSGNQSAVFQFDINTAAGLQVNHVVVEAGKATHVKGPAPKAKVTLKCNLPAFLRIMTGELDGQKAFMSGQLKISGDVMFARNLMVWFKLT